ncbi:hypothetical protein [Candidatus Uabimicrobium amorphum]|uniref:ABM domain-containing protein n=1 Tax=Uabimicrobium amorphum TaxID=2596890 RepID=A0A5S9IMD6_UABAM|nr:hypothetical protein [Candidatus Uabimicrobium amorphum]BBM84563.1 hypothetical protein UABAM_02924 [Candidatus Uabimicrobium amorphum]
MSGIVVRYEYSGDYDSWLEAINVFIDNINNDDKLKGNFSYRVTSAIEGNTKIHIARWKDQETLSYLQSQSFFKDFAVKIKEFGGDTLQATKVKTACETLPLS